MKLAEGRRGILRLGALVLEIGGLPLLARGMEWIPDAPVEGDCAGLFCFQVSKYSRILCGRCSNDIFVGARHAICHVMIPRTSVEGYLPSQMALACKISENFFVR